MVHMRCKHLHSEVRQNINQRIIQQWRSFLSTHSCQTRQASTVVTRSKNGPSLLEEIDSLEHLRQTKSLARRRIPVHISSKIDKQLPSPTTMSIQSYLKSGDVENAWKLVDKSASYLTQQNIPGLTAQLLLKSLHTQVNTNLPRLTLDFAKLQQLYLNRLDLLAGIVRKSKDVFWDTHDIGLVLELYGKLDQVKRAESLFRNLSYYTSSTNPHVEVYNQMMAVYVRRFKYIDDTTKKRYFSKLQTLEQDMIRKGLQPDTSSYNILLAAKIKSHDLKGAEAIYSKMTAPPDRITYNILLNGYLKDCRNNKDKEITQQWMERFMASGIAPNRKTFSSIMDGLATQVSQHARLKEINDMQSTTRSVSALYKVMRRLGHQPDTEMINTLLKCYTAAGDIDHIEEIIEMLVLPEKKGCGGNCACASKATTTTTVTTTTTTERSKIKVKPDTYTFNMLIKYHLGTNNTELAFQMYDTMVNLKLEPDTVTYGNFVWYYANQGNATEALKYVDVMQRKGIPANNYIYNILLNYSLTYQKEAYIMTPHLHRMIADGSSTLDSISLRIPIARFQYMDNDNIGSNFERFTDILENIYATPEISTRTYNTILQTTGNFYKKKHSNINMNLDSIIESLDTSHLRPDIYTYALSIRNATYVGHMAKAESIYKDMVNSGIKPNHFVFSHLIHGYVTLGKVDKASEILQYMANYQLCPTAIHYAPLIKGFAESAEFDKAYQIFRDMLANNVNADLIIYSILASVLLESPRGNEGRAIELLEGIEKAGIPMDAASLTLLAKAYAIQGSKQRQVVYTRKIDTIFNRLKENQWLDAKAITTLLTAHHRMKNPDGAWKLWNTLKQDQVTLTTFHYNSLMIGLTAHKTWYPVAKMVFEEMLQNSKAAAPDVQTLDLMVWGAHGVSDLNTIQKIWHARAPNTVLFVRSYFAVMKAMLECNDIENARHVYEECQELPLTPNSTTVWVNMMHKLAAHQGFSKSISTTTT